MRFAVVAEPMLASLRQMPTWSDKVTFHPSRYILCHFFSKEEIAPCYNGRDKFFIIILYDEVQNCTHQESEWSPIETLPSVQIHAITFQLNSK